MTTTGAEIFRIDANQYLGHSFESYRDYLFSLAISDPSKYFKIREAVVTHVKREAVKNLYQTLFNTLIYGKKTGPTGAWISQDLQKEPQVPSAKVNEICLSAAKTLDHILDEVLDLIVPLDYKTIATRRLTLQGEANIK